MGTGRRRASSPRSGTPTTSATGTRRYTTAGRTRRRPSTSTAERYARWRGRGGGGWPGGKTFVSRRRGGRIRRRRRRRLRRLRTRASTASYSSITTPSPSRGRYARRTRGSGRPTSCRTCSSSRWSRTRDACRSTRPTSIPSSIARRRC